MRAALERWLLARWFGKPGLLWLLLPLEGLYRLVLRLRARRAPRPPAPPVPVIVIGNVVVGGSGKTPLVLALIEAFQARGLQVGVIARGYGGTGPFPLPVTADTPAAAGGDEPLLIARRAGVPVVVDPLRARALECLLAENSLDVVLSDDGLQHAALPRTLEVAVLDGARGLGNGHCLPVGPLREPAVRLESVDFLVANGEVAAPARLPRQAAAVMTLQATRLHRVDDPAVSLGVDDFIARYGATVTAMAGIGNPARFFASLAALGFSVVERPLPDHHVFAAADFSGLVGQPLLMTEKDAVKCAALVAETGLEAWYLAVAAHLPPRLVDAILARAGLGNTAGRNKNGSAR